MIIAVLNSKGGVGKTTTSVNLAGALASSGRHGASDRPRVLLIDLDSQASASTWCGVPRDQLTPSAASCLLEDYPVGKAIRSTAMSNVDLLTGSLELANVDLALCNRSGREFALRELLKNIRAEYDVIVLDCAPGLSLLTINAILAADGFIVPVVPRHLALAPLPAWIAAIDKVRTKLGGRGKMLGILLLMIDARNRAQLTRVRTLRTQFGTRVFRTSIPSSSICEEASAAGKTVLALAPRSSVARAFTRLSVEVLRRARQ